MVIKSRMICSSFDFQGSFEDSEQFRTMKAEDYERRKRFFWDFSS